MAQEEKKQVLEAIFSKSENLASLVPYADDAVISKTLLDKKITTVTLFAFDAGQRLSTHSAPFDAMLQVVDGEAEIVIADETHNVKAGEIIVMPGGIPHAVTANEKFKMLLTMVKVTDGAQN